MRWRKTQAPARLSADPRIEALETRRELERVRTGWQLAAWVALVIGLGIAQWRVGALFSVPLGVAAAGLGVWWGRWQTANADDERIEKDIRALTAVYHQSPRTIRKWLTREFIDDSIRNLLAAALDSEDLANGYWKQAVKPFLTESQRGFKEGWRYQIDIANLAADVPLVVNGEEVSRITAATHRRLHTSVTYTQKVPEPVEVYHVAAVFDGNDLPEWFTRPNFLLREVVQIPADVIARLPEKDEKLEALPEQRDGAAAPQDMDAPNAQLARDILAPQVMIGGAAVKPFSFHVDQSGISWGFHLTSDAQRRMRESTEIKIELETFMARTQRHFPVVISAPTRNPTIQFNYGLSDIDAVTTEVFFSAERPWDPRLRTLHGAYRRVDILTEPHDWVFTGSGCVVAWWDETTTPAPPMPAAEKASSRVESQ